ncbi:MAG TPA: thioredoxin [Thermoplasmatales archaeon]|nr:thioredoxin [Thermoplasmatales archaeon]
MKLFKKSPEKEPQNIKWPDHVISLDDKTFDEFIYRYPLSMVDFWAPWCGPCMVMLPRLRKLSKIYKGKVAFGRLNTQENQDIAKRYKIMSIPHLIVFSYGKKVTALTGVKSVGDIKTVIDRLLKKGLR